jgi:hypothetical protein
MILHPRENWDRIILFLKSVESNFKRDERMRERVQQIPQFKPEQIKPNYLFLELLCVNCIIPGPADVS